MKYLKSVGLITLLTIAVGMLASCDIARAQGGTPVVKAFAGVNGIWNDAAEIAAPNDFEVGANLRASLQPNISLVGATYYGLRRESVRYAGGIRLTATDKGSDGLSVGFGIQYQGDFDEPDLGEWAPDANIGVKPWGPGTPVTLTLQGSYGLRTNEARAYAGARLEVGSFWEVQ